MAQYCALRKLEMILDEAVSNGNKEEVAGAIILQAMGLPKEPENLVDFYDLLKRAEKEAIKIKNLSRIDRYLRVVKELHSFYIINHLWNTKWITFINYINNKNILITLDALANTFSSQNPQVLLPKELI